MTSRRLLNAHLWPVDRALRGETGVRDRFGGRGVADGALCRSDEARPYGSTIRCFRIRLTMRKPTASPAGPLAFIRCESPPSLCYAAPTVESAWLPRSLFSGTNLLAENVARCGSVMTV